MFTGPVPWVGKTEIFACPRAGTRQGLVYSMAFRTSETVAMVLPIPVPAGAPEDDVEFMDMSAHVDFFDCLRQAWQGQYLARGRRGQDVYGDPRKPKLVVHDVGSFEASFVPSLADFERLDKRFRMADDVWRALPQYEDYGFVVFQLRPGTWQAHPMAFEFTRRDSTRLFFPTVHVHDGRVRRLARFDHGLYIKAWPREHARHWIPALHRPDFPSPPPLIDPGDDAPLYRRRVRWLRRNRDTWFKIA